MTLVPLFPLNWWSSKLKLLALWFLVLTCLFSAGCVGANKQLPAQPAPSAGTAGAEEQLGIKVEAIRWSADGYMLDFRYRVVDPERAQLVLDRSVKPYVIDEASGARFLIPSSPKVGAMRQTTRQPEAGRVYWLLFANPAKYIKPGNKVTVVVGDYRLEHLVVEQ
jgi:hypothetical protein